MQGTAGEADQNKSGVSPAESGASPSKSGVSPAESDISPAPPKLLAMVAPVRNPDGWV